MSFNSSKLRTGGGGRYGSRGATLKGKLEQLQKMAEDLAKEM